MNLEDIATFRKLDAQNLIAQINDLPQQLMDAWELGQTLPLTDAHGAANGAVESASDSLRHILLVGMGESAVGADLLAAYAAPRCPIPLLVQRDYDLPAWARGPETLVIASSHSGGTEETCFAFQQALERGCRVMVLTTGGRLAQMGQEHGAPVWLFPNTGQPRAAVGYSFSLLLAVLYRLGLIPDPATDLNETNHAMRNQQTNLLPETPIAFNPAKRMAGQMVGRAVVIFGADYLAPVARRWKCQISEAAKAWAQFEALPEADHNSLVGLNNPEGPLSQMIALFLLAPENHPRNRLRLDFTRQIYMTQGINTDTILARGGGPMAHMWTALHFGDYTAYFLAMAYGEDPTPVDALAMLKEALSRAE